MEGGSELQSTTLDPVDPVDPLDPAACSKLGFRVRETLLFPPETCPGPGLACPGPGNRSGEALGDLWGVLGTRVLKNPKSQILNF